MKERPILFKGEMVRALLNGSKTQTRRVVKELDPSKGACTTQLNGEPLSACCWSYGGPVIFCPYGKPGDRLWVRETWRGVVKISPPGQLVEHGVARYVPDREHCQRVEYAAAQDRDTEPWRPSIHMPRWASRILLEIVSVRVERLNDCSDADALAEGVDRTNTSIPGYATERYRSLWERINGSGSWAANPWVWVVTFRRIEP